jgi:hypothetical protein
MNKNRLIAAAGLLAATNACFGDDSRLEEDLLNDAGQSAEANAVNVNDANVDNMGTDVELDQNIVLSCQKEVEKAVNTIVIMDDNSWQVDDQEIIDTIELASDLMEERIGLRFRLTNISHAAFEKMEHHELNLSVENFIYNLDSSITNCSNYYVVFTESADAVNDYGGFHHLTNMNKDEDSSFCNTITSPRYGTNHLYGSLIDWDHMFSRCGYEDEDNHVSDVSFGGECRGVDGVQCVYNNDAGYYTCPDYEEFYYGSHPLMMRSTAVVHELLHSFGIYGGYDHLVDSDDCIAEYDGTLEDFVCPDKSTKYDCWLSMCKYTWENLRDAPNSCTKNYFL